MRAQEERPVAVYRPHTVPRRVRDLLRPEARGARAGDGASLKTTHASWVVLGAEDVWKLKRPVDLGFLDFRTLEARRHACEEEVRLNRRLAPDVYLGVEPVRRTAGGHAVVGSGPIVDWAVRMRRLPDQYSAAALLADGRLDAELLARLAQRLAAFFAAARPTPAFGGAEILRANVHENFVQAAPMVGEFLDDATYDELRRYQLEMLDRHGARFAARVGAGHIREGHGDLRLDHVYFIPPSTITVIDCIEFNERFRCGDVASEIAFLAMELEASHRPELSAAFVARYAEAAQDFQLYEVLDFYLSYRAFVRGKVAAFVAADPGTPADVRRAKREEARSRFALARAMWGRAVRPPFVVAVGGMIGSGKSTLAAALGRALCAPVVSSDRTRKSMEGVAETTRGDRALYQPGRIQATYGEVLRRAASVVGAGRGVIVDATFAERRWRGAAAELARQAGATFAFIEAACSDEALLRQRLVARGAGPSVSDATEGELEVVRRRHQGRDATDPEPWLTIDTAGDTTAAAAAAREGLRALGIAAGFSHD